jgi:uncharacterized protein (TIGR03435 family)
MTKLRLFVLLAAPIALAQPPRRFEVAVIRPTTAAPDAGTSVNLFEGGRVRIVNEPVKLLVRLAFQLQDSQIAGSPAWLESDRYDVEARTGRPEKITAEEMPQLMQGLLADRFHLKFHRETREIPVYALVVSKGGPKLKRASDGESAGMNTHPGSRSSQAVATATSMDMLAKYVGNRVGRIVLDKTGLTGVYDFTLEWAPDSAADSSAPPLVTALREQLGLRLESQKAPVEVLVIDSISRPTEN